MQIKVSPPQSQGNSRICCGESTYGSLSRQVQAGKNCLGDVNVKIVLAALQSQFKHGFINQGLVAKGSPRE